MDLAEYCAHSEAFDFTSTTSMTGSSTGVPNELGLNLDAVTVMNYAKNHPRYEIISVPY